MENTRLNVPADFAPMLSAMLCDTIQTRIKHTLGYSVTLNTQDDLVFFAREIRTGLLYRLWDEKPFFQHDLTKQVLTVLINSIEKVVMGAWHVPHCLFPYYATNLNAWFELPHTSAKDQTKIATFKTVDAVFRDIQTVQKPAKWFKEFAKGSDVMASEFNNTFLNSIVKPPVFWSLRELNRHDPEAWIWVYSNTQGTGSCMSNNGRSECVKVYAHPENDLDLVFTTKGDRAPFEPGTIVNSRSIFDARDNQFVRIYSDTHLAHHAFLAHVESKGSKETRELNEGHKLLKIEHYHGDNRYFMPYLDGVGSVTDEGDCFTTGGDIDASNTSGWCELRGCCPCCGGSMNYTVWIDSEGQDVCEDCASTDYFYCQLTNEYYNSRTYDEVTILDRWGSRESAEEMAAQNSGYLRCEVGQYEDIYLHPYQAIEDYAGSIIHIDEAHYCELDESYYHESDLDMMPTPDDEADETPEA